MPEQYEQNVRPLSDTELVLARTLTSRHSHSDLEPGSHGATLYRNVLRLKGLILAGEATDRDYDSYLLGADALDRYYDIDVTTQVADFEHEVQNVR